MSETIVGDLVTVEGRQVKFQKETDKPCPSCGTDKNGRMLHVRSDIGGTAQLECPNCSYVENVPSEMVADLKDMKGRPIKR